MRRTLATIPIAVAAAAVPGLVQASGPRGPSQRSVAPAALPTIPSGGGLYLTRPRLTHTRRGVHVAVIARNGRVRGVVVTVRRGGKVIGRSHERSVGGRRVFRIRLTRRMRAGRYVVLAAGAHARTRRTALARSAR